MFGRKDTKKNQRPTLDVVQSDAIRNAANTLLANIGFSSVDAPVDVVAITSSVPNEGKSTITLSLAIAAGTAGKRVLVVECDLRRRSLRATLNAHPSHGLHAVLTGQCGLEEAVVETMFKNVYFLDAEPGIPNPEELLNSKRYAEFVAHARELYELVIIDTPPIGAFADAAVVARQTAGAILVIRENYTDKRDVALAMNQLKASNARVLGTVLNCEEGAGSGHYGYYYGYYYEEERVPADSQKAEAARKAQRGE